MQNLDEKTITAEAIRRLENCKDPRFKAANRFGGDGFFVEVLHFHLLGKSIVLAFSRK